MKLLWYIPRLRIGGAELLSISIINQLSKSHLIKLITDKKNSPLINQINRAVKIVNLNDESGFFYFKKIIKLRKIINDNNNFFFISNLTHANLNSYISLLNTKKKMIAVEHNTLSKYISHKKNIKILFINILCKLIYKKIYKIICVSNYVKKDLILNYKCKNCVTIHNGIDQKKILIKSNLFKVKYINPYIIFVGRLEKQKNLHKLIDIYHKLIIQGIRHDLIIVGNGSELNELKAKVNKLKLIKKVKFLGEKDNPYPYIKKADLSIMTSSFEGFGIFLIESLCLGTKIFTYDKKILSEIISDKKFIEIFTASKSDYANIKKIKYLLKNSINKKKITKLITPYEIKIVAKKYIEIFNS